MSWLDKVLPKISRSNGETAKKDIPAGVWTKCTNCGTTLYAQELRDNLNVCPKCNHHMRVSARQRLDMILDPETDRKSVLKSALWILSGLWTVKNILTASSRLSLPAGKPMH